MGVSVCLCLSVCVCLSMGVWSGLVWSGLVCSGLVWSGLGWSGLVWSGLVWSGLVWSGLVWSGHGHVARIISSQKIYDLYGLKHHIVEMRGGVTDAGQTTNDEQTLKIQLLSQWKLEAEFPNLSTNP